MPPILSIILMIFFFGFCIFIHEYGHLLAAQWRKLHIDRFSIGMGPILWRKTIKGVEYCFSAIPIGGYVALPQMEPGDGPAMSGDQELPPVKPLDKIIVALAGPVFNILFGLFLGVIIWMVGIPRPVTEATFKVGDVPATYIGADGKDYDTPEYVAGLRVGDEVIAVDGKPLTKGFEGAVEKIVTGTGPERTLTILRNGQKQEITYKWVINPKYPRNLPIPFFTPQKVGDVGVGEVFPGSPAAKSGLQKGDHILQINGKPVKSANLFKLELDQNNGEGASLLIERNGQKQNLALLPSEVVEGSKTKKKIYGFSYDVIPEMEIYHPNPISLFTNTVDQTQKTVSLLADKESAIKVEHMSGFVGIGQVIKRAFEHGFMSGLKLVAFISFSLAIFNLLPIPVLDGSHITIALIEMIIGRPLPGKLITPVFTASIVFLLGFMLMVTYHDLAGIFHEPPEKVEEVKMDQALDTKGTTTEAATSDSEISN